MEKQIKYYKTNHQPVLDAWNDYFQCRTEFNESLERIKDYFHASDAFIGHSLPSIFFAGLSFAQTKDTAIWTKPDKNGIQRPRSKVIKALEQQHSEILSDYKKLKPKDVDYDPLLQSVGLYWGNILFGGGFGCVFNDGFFYMHTRLKPFDFMIEITGSDYELAKAAYENTGAAQ